MPGRAAHVLHHTRVHALALPPSCRCSRRLCRLVGCLPSLRGKQHRLQTWAAPPGQAEAVITFLKQLRLPSRLGKRSPSASLNSLMEEPGYRMYLQLIQARLLPAGPLPLAQAL